MNRFTSLLAILPLAAQLCFAQQAAPRGPYFSTDGKWSIGFHGGINLWINDLNTRRIGPGGEMFVRYGLSKRFSLGLNLAYERLISLHYTDPLPASQGVLGDYVALKAGSADLVVWYHFPPTMEIRPYAYIGFGSMAYVRQDRYHKYLPNGKKETLNTIHFPVGFGFEVPVSSSVSFAIDFGARFLDDYTDHWKGNAVVDETNRPGLADWYPTTKVGFNFYLGSKDDVDEDGDGLTFGEERKYGTNPYNADSDGDQLKDGAEVWRYNTDPLKADTDGDNISDGDEVNKYQTFPNKPDSDFDGLNDGMEILKFDTNPMREDSDGDGLKDGDEILKYGTNPLRVDSDNDGLSDGNELQYNTDPRNKDTDAGTIEDGAEVKRGTNPLDKNDDVIIETKELKAEIGKPIILEGVVFKTGSAVISGVSEDILSLALNTLQNHPDMAVEIRGHTDNTGSRGTNDRLSQRRAEAVRIWLVNRGIAPTRIKAVGYGQDSPIDSNLSADGRQRNRRIEFYRTR
jgi:outer membrane protein OmpA-like peptidoglycan-associated protein